MKEIIVSFINSKLKSDYLLLKEGKYEDKKLYEAISYAISEIKKNPLCGIKISKKLWPKTYIKEYQITNLWKYDVTSVWRLIYTIESDDLRIVGIILDSFNHKDYDKKFKY
jgi:Txe/YoeB family toxin of Txe-Axe toxin-antitoxin module